MPSHSNKQRLASALSENHTLTPQERISAHWPEASPQKCHILSKRFQDLWNACDEAARAQMYPSQTQDRKPSSTKNVESHDPKRFSPDLSHIDLLSGLEFEKFVGQAFSRKGYTVEYHGGPTEAGGDLVCWEGSTERVHAILVQVKRERCLTGTKAISQILRKENWFRHKYPEASYEKWVITSSHFSRQAKTEAAVGGIILIDRETFQEWLAREV
jgi:HJR/Mrr/RecB family endonuclease